MRSLIFLFNCLLFCLLLTGCNPPDRTPTSHPSIINGDSVNHKFQVAERYLEAGDYEHAADEYNRIKESDSLGEIERDYARLSHEICLQMLDRHDEGVDIAIVPTGKLRLMGILLEGLKMMNQGTDAQLPLIKAVNGFSQQGLATSPHSLIALCQLGLYHRTYTITLDSSLLYFKRALLIADDYEPSSQHRAFALFHLAEVSVMYRDVMQGLSYVQRALANPISDEWTGRFLTLKGTMFRKLARYDSADYYYDSAERLLSRTGKMSALSELLREKSLKAVLLKDSSLFRAVMGKLHSIDSMSRNSWVNLDRLYGFYYYTYRQPQKLIFHYERALGTLKKQRQHDIVQIGEAYFALTNQYRQLKDFKNAKRTCYEALAYASPLRHDMIDDRNALDPRLLAQENNFILYGLLANVFRDSFSTSRDIEDVSYSLKICNVIDSLILAQVKVKEEDAIINYLPYGHGAYSCGVASSFLLFQRTGDHRYIQQAHQFMEKSKSLLIYRDLLSRKKEYFPDIPEVFLDREMELKGRMAVARKQPGSNEMSEILSEMEIYYRQMEEKYPAYYQSKFQMTVPSFETCQSLSERQDQTFVQYHVSGEAIYFLTYENPPQFESISIDSIFLAELNTLKNTMRKPPGMKKGEANSFARLSKRIYSRLFQPVLNPKPQVLIIPEGPLNQFPFEVLMTDTAGTFKSYPYLVQTFQISYAHSLKIYSMAAAEVNPGMSKILGYAYSGEGTPGTKLPGTTTDLRSLTAAFPESSFTFRVGEAATKAQFLRDLGGDYDLIHVAMHASSSVTDRNGNKIEFTAPTPESGSLYAYELIPKKLKARTVVLASCESSAGSYVTGEGTFNLERAFSQLGASTIVSSAWQMPDQLGSKVLGFFYHRLQEHPDEISGSLSRSKLDYLKDSDELTAHPYFWATFLCIENQRGKF